MYIIVVIKQVVTTMFRFDIYWVMKLRVAKVHHTGGIGFEMTCVSCIKNPANLKIAYIYYQVFYACAMV
jgi:hypothetical protein